MIPVFDHFCPAATTRHWLALKPELDGVIEDSLGSPLYPLRTKGPLGHVSKVESPTLVAGNTKL